MTRRIAMVGAGWVSEFHLKGWQAHKERAEVVAIADPSETARTARASAFNIAHTFPDAATMLREMQVNAIDICAPREVHADLVRLAASAGLPILCQKPLAMTYDLARELVAEVGNKVPLMVHENWRFRAWYRELRRWLDANWLGDIRQVRLDFLSGGMITDASGARPALVRQPFFRTLDRLLVTEVLIHHLDTLRFLFGDLDLISARLERSNDEIVGEDVATLVLARTSDGLPMHVVGNLAVHGKPPIPKDRLWIAGTRGMADLDGNVLRLASGGEHTETFDADRTYQQSYTDAIGHFLDGLDGKLSFETAPEDNLKTLQLVETAYAKAGAVLVR
jgi:predicted dehydrogenase